MSGHSHWSGIKHKKAATDAARAKTFSKLLKAIGAAARTEPNPEFNPRLRTAINKAREAQVPNDVVARALARAAEAGEAFDELLFEAYGPGGIAVLIEVVTDNRNRAVQEIKKILGDHHAKWAEQGSVQWAFSAASAESGGEERGGWDAKFPQAVSEEDATTLGTLVEALENHDDVQRVTTNART